MSPRRVAPLALLWCCLAPLLSVVDAGAQPVAPEEPSPPPIPPAPSPAGVAGPAGPPPAPTIPAATYLPPAPADHVLDLAGIIPTERRQALAAELVRATRDDVHIYLLTLETAPPVDLPTYAGQLSDAWLDDGLAAIIFLIADRDQSPRILTGGRGALAIGPGRVNRAAARAVERATIEPDLPSRLGRTALELRDELTILHHRLLRQTELARPPGAGDEPRPTIASHLGEITVAVLCVLLFLTLLSIALRHARPRPRLFPEVEPRLRLGAPHSGGNNASLSFRPKRSRN